MIEPFLIDVLIEIKYSGSCKHDFSSVLKVIMRAPWVEEEEEEEEENKVNLKLSFIYWLTIPDVVL